MINDDAMKRTANERIGTYCSFLATAHRRWYCATGFGRCRGRRAKGGGLVLICSSVYGPWFILSVDGEQDGQKTKAPEPLLLFGG
jgi:hypothetical protein